MGDLYLGIDLGTTNSVIAYGLLGNSGDLKCTVIDVDRKSETGGKTRAKTLPSVVFYSMNNAMKTYTPEVGDYAKSRYGMIQGYVCKSVKSMMGSGDHVKLNEEILDQTPAQVSSRILQHMMVNARQRLYQDDVSDVVITVPASFDSDQCQDTLDAAKMAGVDIDNTHDILLYEPKAVIYDLVHMQELGEVPKEVIDFHEPKNILVFDLGGGTLDVSIHTVGYSPNGMMNIKDLAIARYSLIGGDNFDELIALDMYQRFVDFNHLTIPEKRKEEVMCKLRKEAEKLKINISDDYDNARNFGKEIGAGYYWEVTAMNLYDSYSMLEEYTIEQILTIIQPLMGEEFTSKDALKIDSFTPKQMNNIIYPILDVLAKAGADCKIDFVLLNGGMTKFFPIKQRIDRFFGLNSLVTANPDLSVARGAVYYHYCLHKYNVKKQDMEELAAQTCEKQTAMSKEEEEEEFQVGTILNDTIHLGVSGEYVSKLVEAGTKLPYCSGEIKGKYAFSKYMDSISVQIFLGRGKTKNLPNRRICDRIIKFKNKYPANTPISISIVINSMRMMRLEAWITGDPSKKAQITLDTNSKKTEKNKVSSASIHTNERTILNAKGELNALKVLAFSQRKTNRPDVKTRMEQLVANIKRAENPEDFYEPIMEGLSSFGMNDVLRGYYYAIAAELCDGWSEKQIFRLLRMAKQHFSVNYADFRHDNYVIRQAAEVICKCDADPYQYFSSDLIREKFSFYEHTILQSLLLRTAWSDKKLAYLNSKRQMRWELKTLSFVIGQIKDRNSNIDSDVIGYLVMLVDLFIKENESGMLRLVLDGLAFIYTDAELSLEDKEKIMKAFRKVKHEIANNEIEKYVELMDMVLV